MRPLIRETEHRQVEKLRKAYRDPVADIYPDTAARYGIENRDWMWIETRCGRIRQRALDAGSSNWRRQQQPRASTCPGPGNAQTVLRYPACTVPSSRGAVTEKVDPRPGCDTKSIGWFNSRAKRSMMARPI